MRVEMVMAAEESEIRRTKRLLSTCMRQGKVREANRTNWLNMEEEGRCATPREIPRHYTSKPHYEVARQDPRWEDSKESRTIIGRRKTGIQKGQRGD